MCEIRVMLKVKYGQVKPGKVGYEKGNENVTGQFHDILPAAFSPISR